jgi:hypothetical protein
LFSEKINTAFITFGAGRTGWRQAAKRISREARAIGIFSEVVSLDEKWLKDFSPKFYATIKQFQSRNLYRGFGYWIWKPLVLKWAMQQYPNLNILYMDSGSHIDQNLSQITKLKNLLLENSHNGLAWASTHKEVAWSKRELVLRINPTEKILQSGQVQAGFIYVPNNDLSNEMINLWNMLAVERNGFYFSDEIEVIQSNSFISHRHDQSAFSMLWKIYEFGFKNDMTYIENLKNFPIISARNNTGVLATSSQTIIATVRNFNLLQDKLLRRR